MTLVALYIPMSIILYNIGWVMTLTDAASLRSAVAYTRTIIIGFFFEAIYDLEKKYLLQFGNALFPMAI